MTALDRIRESLDKAKNGLATNDKTTARAFWRVAVNAMDDLIREATAGKASAVRDARDQFLRITASSDLAESVNRGLHYWAGYEHGLNDGTLVPPHPPAFRLGYSAGAKVHKSPP